ncbi:fam-a protein, fragment [Plasmodium vinckei brucechwatti]|uniref:Fam-a protein n=1 Tax=Plasmodium vinckei brucechwatti TaxID=119398 RepID=A0A6V7RUE9_PLAVN|nr:fam-a protein, fragment [Plasmodium vinckei brucechwatti]
MNKFYIQIVFFLLSIFIYTNNKTLATEPTPGEQNKQTREYALSPELRGIIDAHSRNGLASIFGGHFKSLLKNTSEIPKEQTKEITKQKNKQKK